MKITEFKSKLPYGGVREIAKRLKINEATVGQYFNGERVPSVKKELELIGETLKYLKEIKAKKEELKRELEELEQ